MKTIILPTLLLILSCLPIIAQQENFGWRLGGGINSIHYFGDLSGDAKSVLKEHYTSLDHKFYGPSITLEGRISPSWSMMFSTNKGAFEASDLDHPDSDNFNRFLNAKTKIWDLGAAFELRSDNDRLLSAQSFLSPYIFFGGGITHFNVFADLKNDTGQFYDYQNGPPVLDGNYETEVTNIHTEKTDDYSTIVPNFLAGLGLRFHVGPRISLHLQSELKYVLSDYLDDVSKNYRRDILPDNEPLYHAADPSMSYGTTHTRRGNDNNFKDMYLTSSLSLRYNFGKQKYSFKYPVFYAGNRATEAYEIQQLKIWGEVPAKTNEKKTSRADRKALRKAEKAEKKALRKKSKDEKVTVVKSEEMKPDGDIMPTKEIPVSIEKEITLENPALDSIKVSMDKMQKTIERMKEHNDSLIKVLNNHPSPVNNVINVNGNAGSEENVTLKREIENLHIRLDNFLMQLALHGIASPPPSPPHVSPSVSPAPASDEQWQRQMFIDLQRALKGLDERLDKIERNIKKENPKEGGFLSPEEANPSLLDNPTPAKTGVVALEPDSKPLLPALPQLPVAAPPPSAPLPPSFSAPPAPPAEVIISQPLEEALPAILPTSTIQVLATAPFGAINMGKYFTDFSNEYIYFDLASYKIRSDQRNKIENVGAILKLNPSLKMKLIGYCDVSGSIKYNKALATERVNAVFGYMTSSLGVDGRQLIKMPLGEIDPYLASSDPALDRKVEMIWVRE